MERIPVRRLSISLGMDQRGQVMTTSHTGGPNKKIFVIPGKYASIEVTGEAGKVSIAEVPIGALGWEYEII